MTEHKPFLSIPIVELGSPKVVGGFCSTRDTVSDDEVAALARLKELQREALAVKKQLKAAPGDAALTARLETLRQQAAEWRERRDQAMREKHIRLGHTQITLDG